MQQKLWLGVIFLMVLGSQFGIAVAVHEWRSDDQTIMPNPPTAEVSRACEGAMALLNSSETTEQLEISARWVWDRCGLGN